MGEKVGLFIVIFTITILITEFLFYSILLEYSIELIYLGISIIIFIYIIIIIVERKEFKGDISLKEGLGLFLLSLCVFIVFLFYLFFSSLYRMDITPYGKTLYELRLYIAQIPNFINSLIFMIIGLYYFLKKRVEE